MDDGTTKGLEREPAEIRVEMCDTRAALTNKLELLEDRVNQKVEDLRQGVEATVDRVKSSVHDTVQGVEATVDRVKSSVHDTVQTVKETVDWRRQMNEHPWAMFGGAVFTGFVVSRVVACGDAVSAGRNTFAHDSAGGPPGTVAAPHRATNAEAPTILDKTMNHVNSQVDRLERVAIAAAGDFVERMIAHAVPGLASYLRRFNGTGV